MKLLASASPDIRALGAIGLGLTHDKKYAGPIGPVARSNEAGPMARAASVLALAELGPAPAETSRC